MSKLHQPKILVFSWYCNQRSLVQLRSVQWNFARCWKIYIVDYNRYLHDGMCVNKIATCLFFLKEFLFFSKWHGFYEWSKMFQEKQKKKKKKKKKKKTPCIHEIYPVTTLSVHCLRRWRVLLVTRTVNQ